MIQRLITDDAALESVRDLTNVLVRQNPQLKRAMVDAFSAFQALSRAYCNAALERSERERQLARQLLARGRVTDERLAQNAPVTFVSVHGLCPAKLAQDLGAINETSVHYEPFQARSASAALKALDWQDRFNSPTLSEKARISMSKAYASDLKKPSVVEHAWSVIVCVPSDWQELTNPLTNDWRELQRFDRDQLRTIALFRLGGLIDLATINPIVRKPANGDRGWDAAIDQIDWRLRLPVEAGYHEEDQPPPSARMLPPSLAQQFLEILEGEFGSAASRVDVGLFAAGIEALYGEARAKALAVWSHGTRAEAYVTLCGGALFHAEQAWRSLAVPSESLHVIVAVPDPLALDSVSRSTLNTLVLLDVWCEQILQAEKVLATGDVGMIADSVGASEPLRLTIHGHEHVGRPHQIACALAQAVRESVYGMLGLSPPSVGTFSPALIAAHWRTVGTSAFPLVGLGESLFAHVRVLLIEQIRRLGVQGVTPRGNPTPPAPPPADQSLDERAVSLLTPNECAVWDALKSKRLTGEELAEHSGTTVDEVYQCVREIRTKLGKDLLISANGGGYIRPDAPPPDGAAVRKRRKSIAPTRGR